MKKHLSFFLALFLVLSLVPFSGITIFAADVVASGTCGDNATWTLDSEGVFTVSGSGSMYDYLTVPRTPWFNYRYDIKKLVVENGITRIGNHAFRSCVLTELDFAPSVVEIGENAFEGCSFTELDIPESVTAIGAFAFLYNNVRDLHVPATLTSIGKGAFGFYDNSFWGTLTVDAKNPVYHASGNCLIETATKTLVFGRSNSVIPEDGSVTVIGDSAFYDSSITEIKIPNTVTRICKSAFYSTNLTKITIPASVTHIETCAFESSGLVEVTIPATVQELGTAVFNYCTSLTKVQLPDNMTEISEDLFSQCEKLTTVNLPSQLELIGDGAFSRCTSLNRSLTIPDKVKFIGASAFGACSYENVYIGKSVEIIAEGAFASCTSLTNVSIPESIKIIQFNAFSNCPSLQYNTFEKEAGVYLGNSSNPYLVLCGVNDMSIENFEMHDKTKVIYDQAFANCSSMTAIKLSKNLTSIGYRAFYYCNLLTEITLPETVTYIYRAFENCASLEYYTKDNGLYLGSATNPNFAFINIYSKQESKFAVLDGTEIVASMAFSAVKPNDRNYLEEITLPDSIRSICDSAFVSCYISEICIPEGVEYVSKDTFDYTHSDLTDIYCEAPAKPELWNVNWNTSDAVVHWNCNNVTVEPENDFEGGTEIIVDEMPVISLPLPEGMILDLDTMLCYDIYLEKAGVKVQPNGSVSISIKVPEYINPERAKVYYLSLDGALVEMDAVYENGFFVFTAYHFSYYLIAEEKEMPKYSRGDANTDGRIDYIDYMMVRRYCMGTYKMSEEELAYSDVDGSGNVDYLDYMMIRRHCMGNYVLK